MSYASCGPLLYAEAFIKKKEKKPGPISTTVNTVYTVKVGIKSTILTSCNVLPCFAFHITILHADTHSYDFEEHACDVHVLRKWQGCFRI